MIFNVNDKYILARGYEEDVPVLRVLDDDQGVAGDGNESLQLDIGAAFLHHHGPGQSSSQAGVRGEAGTDGQFLLWCKQCCN